ncbi:MAG: SIS domain-containing protein [Christensenellaceae bacterium]|jgi:6-phospho-3-hexuloisomerase
MLDRVKLREQVADANIKALTSIKQEELDALVTAIIEANRIFVAGWGRAGNMIKILSMNCSQIGLKTFVVGDNSTPSIHEGDLFVIGSGKGTTATMLEMAKQCKAHGAKLALVTSVADSPIGDLADLKVVIPRAVPLDSWQDAPSAVVLSYYQTTIMVVDVIMAYVMDELGKTFKDVQFYHNNLE